MSLRNSPSNRILSVLCAKSNGTERFFQNADIQSGANYFQKFFRDAQCAAEKFSGEFAYTIGYSQVLLFEDPENAFEAARMLSSGQIAGMDSPNAERVDSRTIALATGEIFSGEFRGRPYYQGVAFKEAAAMVEGLCPFSFSVLCSENFSNSLQNVFDFWVIDRICVGEEKPFNILEIFPDLSSIQKACRKKWECIFMEGLDAYFDFRMDLAQSRFADVAEGVCADPELVRFVTHFRDRAHAYLFRTGDSDVLEHLRQAGAWTQSP